MSSRSQIENFDNKKNELARARLISINMANHIDTESLKHRVGAEVLKALLNVTKQPTDGYVKIARTESAQNNDTKKVYALHTFKNRIKNLIQRIKLKKN